MNARRKRARGFTLIELVVVLTLLAIMAMSVTPVFRGSFSGAQADHAARDLFADLKAAQANAVTEAKEYRVYFAPKENRYWTAHATRNRAGEVYFEPVPLLQDAVVRLPDRLVITKMKARPGEESGTGYLAFYPTGSSDIGAITLTDARDRNRAYVVETTGTRVHLTLPE